MAANNDHTRKIISTGIRPTTDAYREGWERIFGKDEDAEPPKPKLDPITLASLYKAARKRCMK